MNVECIYFDVSKADLTTYVDRHCVDFGNLCVFLNEKHFRKAISGVDTSPIATIRLSDAPNTIQFGYQENPKIFDFKIIAKIVR